MMGALIVTILGGIMMLFFDFGGGYWRNDLTEGRFWISPLGTWYGFLLALPMVAGMFYMAYWSSQAMRDPSLITVSQLFRFYVYGLLIGTFMVILGIVFATVMIWDDYNDWWFDAGFYGGVIGGFLTAIVFNLAMKQAKALGYPDGNTKPPLPFNVPGVQPPLAQQPDHQYPVQQPPFQQPPGQQPPGHQPPGQQPPSP
jgi:hypothetical protein